MSWGSCRIPGLGFCLDPAEFRQMTVTFHWVSWLIEESGFLSGERLTSPVHSPSHKVKTDYLQDNRDNPRRWIRYKQNRQ